MMVAAVPWLDEAFPGRERGLAYGVQNLVYAAGYAVGPILGGLLLEAGDADLAYGLAAALGVGARAHDPQPWAPRDDSRRPQARGRARASAAAVDRIGWGRDGAAAGDGRDRLSFALHPTPRPGARCAPG